jgi:rhodanese-related sulfurtransferase
VTARSADDLLALARRRIRRVEADEVEGLQADGALVVDIRPAAQRATEGELGFGVVVERNVLEWRFDPASTARLPQARYDLRVIVFCSEGYTSSLAAAALQDLGLSRATDLDGGFQAWKRAGLAATAPAQSSVS